MKPVLYHTLVRGYPGYRVVAVTSEKTRRVFGRYVDECTTTHKLKAECLGRFADAKDAQAKVDEVAEIQLRFRPLHDAAANESHRLWQAEAAEIQKVTDLERP